GLLIIDVSNPDSPALLGTLDLKGRGVEMYVIGDRVYVILSADYAYAVDTGVGVAAPGTTTTAQPAILPGPMPPPPDFSGSQVGIIDVSNPASPVALSKINLVGYANDSRRVGDIIYVVGGTGYPYYFRNE